MAMHGDLRFPLEAFALLLQQIFPKTMELSTIRRARIRLLVDETLGWNMMKWVSCWARCFLKMWRGEVLGSSHFTRLVGWWFFEVIESQEEVEEVVSVNLFGGLGSHCFCHKLIDIIMFFWTTWSLGQQKNSNHVHLYGASLQTWCRSLWGTGGDRFGPHFANFDARPRKKPLRCFLIYGKTWENAHVGEGVSEGHKNCWNQKGWYAWSSQLLLHQCILCTASRFLSPGPFWRWVHLKLFRSMCMFFFWISCSLCLFFPHAQWSKPPVDLFYIGDYTSPVIYIFYIAYD